jgi:hypothetical protein
VEAIPVGYVSDAPLRSAHYQMSHSDEITAAGELIMLAAATETLNYVIKLTDAAAPEG